MNNESSPARKSRGPSDKVTDQLKQATLHILRLEGPYGLKMEAIAERASVHKTTLYRRYGDPHELVKAIIPSMDLTADALPDTGSLKTDIQVMVNSFARHFKDPDVAAVNRWVVSRRYQDEGLAEWIDQYWLEHAKLYTVILDRAEARGEHPKRDALPLAIELIAGPMLMRRLVTDMPIDSKLIEELSPMIYALLRGL